MYRIETYASVQYSTRMGLTANIPMLGRSSRAAIKRNTGSPLATLWARRERIHMKTGVWLGRGLSRPRRDGNAIVFISEQTFVFDASRMSLHGGNKTTEAKTCLAHFSRNNTGYPRFHCTPAGDKRSRIIWKSARLPRFTLICAQKIRR